jgi:N-acetyl sugar amidotransferase
MRYCRNCILPDTRPNLRLDSSGVCNACTNHASKRRIDWAARGQAFRQVAARARSRSRGYDCLVPVSGGKDSTWQVVKCLEYGLKPLAVTWKTPGRTHAGARNLANLVNLGIDHIDYQVSPRVERKFMYRALVERGSTAIPMHLALFSIPLKIAVRFDVPLVVWGENSAFEYGSKAEEDEGFRLTAGWLRTYGVSHGTTADDWVGPDLTRQELTPYYGPTDEELSAAGVTAVFLGYYFPWSPENSLAVASAHGFRADEGGPRTGCWNYADIDDDFISVHHYLKWYKFGFTRLFDNLSVEIRNGRITRPAAIARLRESGEQAPLADVAKFCAFVGITEGHFFQVIERFRNPDVWVRRNGVWMIENFLVPDWDWAPARPGVAA